MLEPGDMNTHTHTHSAPLSSARHCSVTFFLPLPYAYSFSSQSIARSPLPTLASSHYHFHTALCYYYAGTLNSWAPSMLKLRFPNFLFYVLAQPHQARLSRRKIVAFRVCSFEALETWSSRFDFFEVSTMSRISLIKVL